MRKKYKQLFSKSNKVEIVFPKQLSQQEIELIERVTKTVEEKIQEMKILSNKEKRKVVVHILFELKEIEEYPLSIIQAEKLYRLVISEELQRLNISAADKADFYMNRAKRKIINQFIEAIEFKQYEIEDIETLKKLERKITFDMTRENLKAGTVKSKIINKISAIQQKNTTKKGC